jgi:hypothetical protein
MALLLGDLPGVEQVELDFSGDVGDAGLAGLAGGEVVGLLGLPGLARSGRSRTKNPGMRIFGRNTARARSSSSGGKAATVAAAACRACGKLMRSGGMPMASTPTPAIWQMAW